MAESEFGVGRTPPRESEMETAAGRSFHEQQNSVVVDAAREQASAPRPPPGRSVADRGRKIERFDHFNLYHKITLPLLQMLMNFPVPQLQNCNVPL